MAAALVLSHWGGIATRAHVAEAAQRRPLPEARQHAPAHVVAQPPGLTLAAVEADAGTSRPAADQGKPVAERRDLPAGIDVLGFENLEGVMLLRATLRTAAGLDTSVQLVLDTGAGYLALDGKLAAAIGLEDSVQSTGDAAAADEIRFAPRALPRLTLESLQMDQVTPVMVFNARVIREVIDRPVAGLIGQSLFAQRALQVDYRSRSIAIIPIAAAADEGKSDAQPGRDASRTGGAEGAKDATKSRRRDPGRKRAPESDAIARSRLALGGVLAPEAVPLEFTLAGDGKMLVRGRVSDPEPPRFSKTLTLVLDTGATKCVLFAGALEELAPRAASWRSMKGLAAPTLFETASAHIVRIPMLEITGQANAVTRRNVDAAVMQSDLSEVLSRAVREPVHGLLGYSFLKHYRMTIDYPHRVVWLEPQPHGWNERPYEYSHIGVQLARSDGAMRVLAVIEGSPAARAGILPGDVVEAVDRLDAGSTDMIEVSRALEGAPGTTVTLTLRRGEVARTYRLMRRWLL